MVADLLNISFAVHMEHISATNTFTCPIAYTGASKKRVQLTAAPSSNELSSDISFSSSLDTRFMKTKARVPATPGMRYVHGMLASKIALEYTIASARTHHAAPNKAPAET